MNRFEPAANIDDVVSEAVRPQLVAAARQITARAADNVNRRTGYYGRRLRVTVDDRGVVAEAMDPFGHLIEWGSINNAPQAPIRRAAESVGKFTAL